MKRFGLRAIALPAVGGALLALCISNAQAGGARENTGKGAERPYVVAQSMHGNGSVRGPVRPSRWGRQVRLPSGMWLDCGISCAHTLRVESIDFWENQGDSSDGVGYLSFERNF